MAAPSDNLPDDRQNISSRCQSKVCAAPGICQRSSVIYKATCRICGLFYVGLMQRVRKLHPHEHVTAARERSRSSTLGEHYHTQHPVPEDADDKDRQPSITFEVLSQHRDILHLHPLSWKQWRSSRSDSTQPQGRALGNGLSSLISFLKNFSKKKNDLLTPFFLHILFIYKHTHTPHSRTSQGKLETKLGPVSFSLYRTLYTTNHLSFFLFLYNRKIPVQCPVDELKMP